MLLPQLPHVAVDGVVLIEVEDGVAAAASPHQKPPPVAHSRSVQANNVVQSVEPQSDLPVLVLLGQADLEAVYSVSRRMGPRYRDRIWGVLELGSKRRRKRTCRMRMSLG